VARSPTAVRILGAATVVAIATSSPAVRAFDLHGHAIIEATAYKRLLASAALPEVGVSGRTVLAALIAEGVLLQPPCFDGHHPRGGCGAEDRLRRPLAYWPVLGSSTADLIIDRQLSARAQCQHFMAETADGLSPPNPVTGIPGALETTAYTRCVAGLGVALEGIARDPLLARARLVGAYALMHAVEDSFSAAHAARDADGRIEHLLSWKLLDWPTYRRRGLSGFPAATHHGVTDERDSDYLRKDGRADDGTPCADLPNPYAVPESCLTPRARAAAAAVADLLVLAYRLRARARAEGRAVSFASDEDRELWRRYVAAHLASAVVAAEDPPPGQTVGFPRTDLFLGVRGSLGRHGEWGTSLWGSRLFFGPAVPFALLLSGGAGYEHVSTGGQLTGALGLGLALPLIRRFTIGFAPAGLAVTCDVHLAHCAPILYATLGVLVIPLPASMWLGLEGPRWSWNDRALVGPVFALSLGWSHEDTPHAPPPDEASARAWSPPAPAEVSAYRAAPVTWALSLAATAGSTADNEWLGGQFDLRWDRDRWDRRAGIGPAVSLSIARGTIDGAHASAVTLAPSLYWYVLADKLAAAATPVALRVDAPDGHEPRFDAIGLLSIIIDVARVEVAVDSPPLSYVSTARWHALPLAVRLGLLLE
jgi:hypothetical protein